MGPYLLATLTYTTIWKTTPDSHIAICKVERAFIRLMTTPVRVRDAPDNR